MIDMESGHSLSIVVVGTAMVLSLLLKMGCERLRLPALVACIALGLSFRLVDSRLPFLSHRTLAHLEFLAKLGVICLLFRIGLESKVRELLRQLRRAVPVWIGGVLTSGFLGYVAAAWFMKLEALQSLFIAVAFTATSVGMSVSVWQERQALGSTTGQLLVDVAELDDLSGIVLMALLFSVVPAFHEGPSGSLTALILGAAAGIFGKLILFAAACLGFSLYLEERITGFFRRLESPTDFMLGVAGIGFIIAALAGLLGFSTAIGAFFAGLAFSRDPDSVKIDASFEALHDLFSPFFFIGIGLMLKPEALAAALGSGLLLTTAAFIGKILGHGLPAWLSAGKEDALLIGFSMTPRAEIAMIIMEQGLAFGASAVTGRSFAAMVMVSAATCVIGPVVVRRLLDHWPRNGGTGGS
ncbi:MAG: cation:proton antiporter [Thermodesulfobacteriota bacterium]|nr:cation:proton antiporter [Thermodesulfobacteriota bacterium]